MFSLIKETLRHFKSHNARRMAAALSFYALLSFIPLLYLVIMLCTFLFDKPAVVLALNQYLTTLLGSNAAENINAILQSITLDNISIYGAIFTGLFIILGSVGVFYELKKSFIELWADPSIRVLEPFKLSIRKVFKRNVIAFSVVPILSLLLVFSISITVLLSTLEANSINQFKGLINLAHIFIPFILGTVLFVIIYRIMPDFVLPWKILWKGALVTAFLFVLGNTILSAYLRISISAHTLGSGTSIIGLLIWLYYSSIVFFFGASYMYVYAKRRGFIFPRVEVQSSLPL